MDMEIRQYLGNKSLGICVSLEGCVCSLTEMVTDEYALQNQPLLLQRTREPTSLKISLCLLSTYANTHI